MFNFGGRGDNKYKIEMVGGERLVFEKWSFTFVLDLLLGLVR